MYKATGIKSATATFTPSSTGTSKTVTFSGGTEAADGTIPYSYVVPEADKKTGTFALSISWDDYTDKTTRSKEVYVYGKDRCQSFGRLVHVTGY